MEEVTQPMIPQTPVVPVVPVEAPPPKNKSKTPLIIPLIILVLVAIVGAVYLGMKIQERGGLQQVLTPPGPEVNYGSPTLSPTVVPTAVPTVDPTVAWAQFQNKEYSLKYPGDVFVEGRADCANCFCLNSSEESTRGSTKKTFQLCGQPVIENPKGLAFKDFIKTKRNVLGNFKFSEENLGQYKIYLTESFADYEDALLVFLTNDDKKFAPFVLIPYNTDKPFSNQDEHYKLMNNVLSTFKFLGSAQTDETVIWKTYTNSKYGYSFKYPTNSKSVEGPGSKEILQETVLTFAGPNSQGVGEFTDGYIVNFSVVNNPSQKTSSQFAQEFYDDSASNITNKVLEGDISKCKIEPVVRGGVSGTRFTYCTKSPGSGILEFSEWFIKNGVTYNITANLQNINYQSDLDQILSTFKFLK